MSCTVVRPGTHGTCIPGGVDDVNLNAALFDFTGISRENAAATKPGSGRDAFSPGSALTLILVSS